MIVGSWAAFTRCANVIAGPVVFVKFSRAPDTTAALLEVASSSSSSWNEWNCMSKWAAPGRVGLVQRDALLVLMETQRNVEVFMIEGGHSLLQVNPSVGN